MNATPTSLYGFAELLADGVLVVDATGKIVHCNAALLNLLHYTAEALIGQPLSILIPEEYRVEHTRLFEEFRDGDISHKPMADRSILYALDRQGRELPVSISIAKITDGGEPRLVAIMRQLPAELSELKVGAETDSLTGAANRLYLSRRIKQLVEQGEHFGLLYLDLDRFKPVNDAYGHAVGDEILKIVVRRAQRVIRSEDLIARVGGDEFVVLVVGTDSPAELESIGRKIGSQVAEKMKLDDFEGSVSASIGCVISPRDGTVEKTLLERADSAMYGAKRSGEGYRTYSDPAS